MFDDVINNLCGGPREYGVVLGSFSPMHTGHLDLVMAAKKLCSKGAIIAVCGLDGDRGTRIGLLLNAAMKSSRRCLKATRLFTSS